MVKPREITDSLWPAGDLRTRPLMPLRKGHMAMLVAAGFLDNLCLESDGQRILVKGRTSKEFVLVEATEDKETYRERLRTTVVSLDLDRRTDHRHRRIDGPSRQLQSRGSSGQDLEEPRSVFSDTKQGLAHTCI